MSPGYLSITPFCFQDFGSFLLSLVGILYQVDSLSLPLLFGLVGIYPVAFLLGISLPFHLVYIAVFGVAFPYSGSLWFLFIVEVPCCGWGWMGGCQGFLVREACVGVLVGGAGFLLSGVQLSVQ